jgi:hypothetical protein
MEDLPDDVNSLSDGELTPLLRYWEDLRHELDQAGQLVGFRSKLDPREQSEAWSFSR